MGIDAAKRKGKPIRNYSIRPILRAGDSPALIFDMSRVVFTLIRYDAFVRRVKIEVNPSGITGWQGWREVDLQYDFCEVRSGPPFIVLFNWEYLFILSNQPSMGCPFGGETKEPVHLRLVVVHIISLVTQDARNAESSLVLSWTGLLRFARTSRHLV